MSCHRSSTTKPPRARRPLTSPSVQLSGSAGNSFSMLLMTDKMQKKKMFFLEVS